MYRSASKTLNEYCEKHSDKFESCHSEANNDRGLDYWVYCREPYFNPLSETQTIHEDTVKETLEVLRFVEEGVFNGYCWERKTL